MGLHFSVVLSDICRVLDGKALTTIRRKYKALVPEMNERCRRQWSASEARELGDGGISLVSRAAGISRSTISAGLRELKLPRKQREREAIRIRKSGAGRPRITIQDPVDSRLWKG